MWERRLLSNQYVERARGATARNVCDSGDCLETETKFRAGLGEHLERFRGSDRARDRMESILRGEAGWKGKDRRCRFEDSTA